MTIGNDTYKIQKRLKINLFTPAFFASLKLYESEEGE
jgi:hypothetical protein